MNAKDLEKVEFGTWCVMKIAAGPIDTALFLGQERCGSWAIWYESNTCCGYVPCDFLSVHAPGEEGHEAAKHAAECFGKVGKWYNSQCYKMPLWLVEYFPKSDIFLAINEHGMASQNPFAKSIADRQFFDTREEAMAALYHEHRVPTLKTIEHLAPGPVVCQAKCGCYERGVKQADAVADDAYREGFENGGRKAKRETLVWAIGLVDVVEGINSARHIENIAAALRRKLEEEGTNE